ncbi:MAG: hypothetical protein LWW85_15775, partial [Marinilabiliales bacterium]|nr:hypothetical protein [Marinilabiliales bacterium]
MNRLSPFLLLLLALSCSLCRPHGQKGISSDRDRANLKGSGRSLSETLYNKEGESKTVIFFDEEGWITSQASYNTDGSLIRRWEYDFENGKRKSKRCYVKKDSLSYLLSYVYDGELLVANYITEKGKAPALRSQFAYDIHQNLIREADYDETGLPERVKESTYDSLHR